MSNIQRLKDELLHRQPDWEESQLTSFECQISRVALQLWETAEELQIDHKAPVSYGHACKLMSAGVIELFGEVSQMPRGTKDDGALMDLSKPGVASARFDRALNELVQCVQRARGDNYQPIFNPTSPELWERLRRRVMLLILDTHEQGTTKDEDEVRTDHRRPD